MKNTRHVTLFALQASDAHSYIAEKRSNPLSPAIPFHHPSCGAAAEKKKKKTSEPASSLLSIVPLLISFNLRNTTGAVSPQLCIFFSSLSLFFSWIHFLSKTFSISPGGLQPPNSRWHLKYTNLSRILSLSHVVSLCSSTLCSNRLWLFHHSQTLHFHIHRHERNGTRQTGGGAYPLPPVSTPLARCHLLKPHPSSSTLQSGAAHWDETLEGDEVRSVVICSFIAELASFAQKRQPRWWSRPVDINFSGSDTILWGNKDVFNKSLVWCQEGGLHFLTWEKKKEMAEEHACPIWQPLYKQ